ncbi:MAG: glycosyltransferase family 4 protein [Xylanivirga thermophila]|jgi:L-malate glycosyltransferase|uniref:glycosyltransferase family 4 protein n=1 Tax=Xylanivirga thermophila TaxID=2496273 RepID=UPI0039F58D08
MWRVDQIMPTIVYGDAVSNHALALKEILHSMGYKSEIYAQNIGESLRHSVYNVDDYKATGEKNAVIYHMSTGTDLNYKIRDLKVDKKIMIYHNITPPEYMMHYSLRDYKIVKAGREQLNILNDSFDYVFGDSEYNCKELLDLGYEKVEHLPILIPYSDYEKQADKDIMEKYTDGNVNILFVGRIAPNKRQEDIIKTFYYYKKYINPGARLFLVGSYEGMERYYNALLDLVNALDIEDVYFTGKVPFSHILAYYRVANVFLCMSEHEGFCVPLIESMYFNVPIIAYNAAAIPYTLDGAGILINKKDYIMTAELINRLVNDKTLKDRLVHNGRRRLEYFSYDNISDMFKRHIQSILGN